MPQKLPSSLPIKSFGTTKFLFLNLGFNTSQLAVADLERLKLPVVESEKFR